MWIGLDRRRSATAVDDREVRGAWGGGPYPKLVALRPSVSLRYRRRWRLSRGAQGAHFTSSLLSGRCPASHRRLASHFNGRFCGIADSVATGLSDAIFELLLAEAEHDVAAVEAHAGAVDREGAHAAAAEERGFYRGVVKVKLRETLGRVELGRGRE
jgi:hypothetical protein